MFAIAVVPLDNVIICMETESWRNKIIFACRSPLLWAISFVLGGGHVISTGI